MAARSAGVSRALALIGTMRDGKRVTAYQAARIEGVSIPHLYKVKRDIERVREAKKS